ncbi:MAG: heavy metal translocating P-type ATPase [Rhodospirillaceae bacterium]|nr:heavy metal translocating P-type ATPase [Rhodospirillaceae bacterium]
MSAHATNVDSTLAADGLPNLGCCPTARQISGRGQLPAGPLGVPNAAPDAYVARAANGEFELAFILDNLTCAACVGDIEGRLSRIPGITSARVNLTLGRLRVTWTDPAFAPSRIAAELTALGYRAIPYDAAKLERLADDRDKKLLRAMAVAGFAAANIMLISVSVWSGNVTDMGPATRDFFHWISALIALPAIAYAGQPFFASAWGAVRHGRVNMDVPISLGVLLATLASVMESARSGEHAYFDAAVMLLFFLLIGRYLDQNMRAKTQSVAANLLALQAVAATVIEPDGRRRSCPADQLRPGMVVAVAPGDRIPADGIVTRGRSDVDTSLVSGESLPQAVAPGTQVYAGTLALSGGLDIEVTSADRDTLLGQIVALMTNATQAKSGHTMLADRAARLYAPAVHVLAATTFAGWMLLGAGGWHPALMAAVAVLIITCPCALGLAVPAVQTVATAALLRAGVLLKSGEALERLAEVDTVVFDKTGTLTLGQPEYVGGDGATPEDLALAARLAQSTRHPLAQALVRHVGVPPRPVPVQETPGLGVSAIVDGRQVRLGHRDWCGGAATSAPTTTHSELWLKVDGRPPVRFFFRDAPRGDARRVIEALRNKSIDVEMLSGDRRAVAAPLAQALGIVTVLAEARPDAKVAHLKTLAAQGRKVLMVGDGLNDAPALALAHVSMAPASGADISQSAADIVYRGEALDPVRRAIAIARVARRRMRENLILAVIYNVLAVPLAMAGLVTPLIAALAMSGSSIVVVLNALRLSHQAKDRAP